MKIETVKDYITDKEVKANPEEIDAVQPLCKELVEIYGYPKENIKSHPQHRVATSPSDENKTYPVDIAVFEKGKVKIICECKAKTKKQGKKQLMTYLNLEDDVKYGVWFNGVERAIYKKVLKGNSWDFPELYDIPRYGEDDFKTIKVSELKPYHNLWVIFSEIKKFLQANISQGSTQETDLANNFIRVLFCKIYDERFKGGDEYVEFFIGEEEEKTKEKIQNIFEKAKSEFFEVFDSQEFIAFSPSIIHYLVSRLQNISFMNSGGDAFADAFEAFIGKSMRGEHGQFFTPRNVIKFIVKLLGLEENDKVIDPACGTGGFLVETLRQVWLKMDTKYSDWDKEKLQGKKLTFANKNIFGVDKDEFVTKICKSYMCLMGDGTSNIINDDSLVRLVKEKKEYKVILTNPPFGDDIKVKEHKILKNFQLSSKKDNKYLATAPEILFLELCVKLLEKKGKLGIVLPEGIFGNETDLSVRKFIFDNVVVKYVISLPTETFLPRTGNKSSVLIAEKNSEKINDNYEVVFIKIKKVGRNKRGETLYKYNLSGELEVDKDGNKIIDDDFLELMKKDLDIDKISLLNNFRNKPNIFKVPVKRIRENDFILIPNYYYNGTSNSKDQKEDKHHVTIRELIKGNVILTNKKGNIPRGKEIGSHSYLKSWEGDVPFIRTSDISNLEISRKPQKWTSHELYEKLKTSQDIQPYDILLVKDGDERVGETALVMPGEEKILLQSHIYKIRLAYPNKFNLDPFNFLYFFNQPEVLIEIKNNVFVQGTIPSIGNRLEKIGFWLPKDKNICQEISNWMKKNLLDKYNFKKKVGNFPITSFSK